MIALTSGARVYLACGVSDMHKGMMGLAMLVQQGSAGIRSTARCQKQTQRYAYGNPVPMPLPPLADRERLVKIGAEIVQHGRSVTFKLAEVMISRGLFQHILGRLPRCARCCHQADVEDGRIAAGLPGRPQGPCVPMQTYGPGLPPPERPSISRQGTSDAPAQPEIAKYAAPGISCVVAADLAVHRQNFGSNY